MTSGRKSISGFTLVELMISVVIGLVTTLVMAEVLMYSEGQKRTTTAGSDAQINGAQAIYSIQRDIQMAGYGFATYSALLGCPIYANYGGVPIATGATVQKFASVLAPVVIDFSNVNRNAIRILSSSKVSYAIPIQIADPGFTPSTAASAIFPVFSTLSIGNGDIMIAAKSDASRCDVFKVSAAPTVSTQINRIDDTGWNSNNAPGIAYGFNDILINMGSVTDHKYSISTANNLQLTKFSSTSPGTTPVPADLYPDIVILQALYGKDKNLDKVVDTYDRITPTSTDGWKEVLTIRIAIVARSAQYEKNIVTAGKLSWDVGSTTTVNVTPATTTCGTDSKCISLNIDDLGITDWQHYRYKVFDTVIPIKNMLWTY
jgi:type IV pilus assembly protein PilW